jgi:uncharacterized protein (TIGR00661 family)
MKRVLVAPLDWGLGHAARCVPVVHKFLSAGCEVVLGGNGASLQLLRADFPTLAFITLPAYSPQYPRSGSMVWKMASQLPKFIRAIYFEHVMLRKFVDEQKIDMVISDNRYGLFNTKIPCVLITHQSNILMPQRFGWLQRVVRYFNHRLMRKFTVCWIPDLPDKKNCLAGELTFASTESLHVEHIGILSRFTRQEISPSTKYQVLLILSGPEPQRTILENIVVPQLKASGFSYFVVRGKEDQISQNDPHVANFLATDQMLDKISSCELVICRSGYSSVMDLAALQKKAVFIPTPGQTEQEYLARTLHEKGIAFSMSQHGFDLKFAVEESRKYKGFPNLPQGDESLTRAIEKILAGKTSQHEDSNQSTILSSEKAF